MNYSINELFKISNISADSMPKSGYKVAHVIYIAHYSVPKRNIKYFFHYLVSNFE